MEPVFIKCYLCICIYIYIYIYMPYLTCIIPDIVDIIIVDQRAAYKLTEGIVW